METEISLPFSQYPATVKEAKKPSELTVALTLQTRIQEVHGSDFGGDTDKSQ
jgi:hypothetical protein